MSALGHKRTNHRGLKSSFVRFGLIADICNPPGTIKITPVDDVTSRGNCEVVLWFFGWLGSEGAGRRRDAPNDLQKLTGAVVARWPPQLGHLPPKQFRSDLGVTLRAPASNVQCLQAQVTGSVELGSMMVVWGNEGQGRRCDWIVTERRGNNLCTCSL